jgi:hypothetical protein
LKTRELLPVIYLGTPGSTRKAVAILVDPVDGVLRGVLKTPLGQGGADGILREAKLLEKLRSQEVPGVPRLLFCDSEGKLSVQEAARGKPSGRRVTAAHLRWLCSLRQSGETSLAAASGPWREALLGLVDGLSAPARTRLTEALERRAPLPTVWEHGDFAPWNLLVEGQNVTAVDWEDGASEGLPLQDLCHFHWVQRFLLGDGRRARQRMDADLASAGAAFGLAREAVNDLRLHYLAREWVRRQRHGMTAHAVHLRAEIEAEATR